MKARLPKGMGGGPKDMNAMIREAQKVQARMEEVQEELNQKEYKATAGGGMVEVVMTGNKRLTGINLKPEVVNPEDIDMLQDLLAASINQVIEEIEKEREERMEQLSGGINLPGFF